MDTLYLICAGLGGTIIVLQMIAGVLGLGGDHDVDTEHDHDHGNGFFGLLTLRSVAAAVCFFGLTGLTAIHYEVPTPGTLAAAALGGCVALYGVASVMELFQKLKHDGTTNLEDSLGTFATVYLRIPGGDTPGKVTLNINNRTVECEAFSNTEIPTGRTVKVVAIRDAAVEVEAVSSSPPF